MNTYDLITHNFDELYHHGIKGQKWGKKNGPPYPLGASDHSASEQKAGWRKSLSNDGKKNEKNFKTKDFFKARKNLKKIKVEDRTNYNKVVNKWAKKLQKEAETGNLDSFDEAFDEAKKAVKRALLMDAGMSKEKAVKGAEWMMKNGWSLTFSDTIDLFDKLV